MGSNIFENYLRDLIKKLARTNLILCCASNKKPIFMILAIHSLNYNLSVLKD